MKKESRIALKDIAYVLLGNLIVALSINVFIIPHKLISSGVSGIALILQYALKIPAGYMVVLLNIPLFILSILQIDKKFTYLTIIGTIAQSLFMMTTRNLSSSAVVKDTLLSCIYGGVSLGIGLGLVFTCGGSSGGTDVISVFCRRKYNMEIGKVSFAINFVIILMGGILFGIETSLYTLVSVFISAAVVDRVINGLNRKKLLLIVTEKEEEITAMINEELQRGATVLYGEGSFTRQRKNVIYCAVSPSQVTTIKRKVMFIDPNAFTSILDASEVQGRGFQMAI